ncbi:MAG TPA: hypothetical protein VI997_05355 [Candidatus Thermoplasmatota archaeon]|nr:hypothetical protein [Candidatus Thermoplasmatota archaeon]
MPPRSLVVALALVVPVAALAGCADDEAPLVAVKATATDGFLMMPLDYGGDGRAVTGDALVDVDAVANTGTVRVTATAGNDSYGVTWSEFRADPTKPFQDGGIATRFHEHGASGTGDTSIPEVNLIAAGWGPARVTKNGEPLPDPVTGGEAWAGHFMITDTGAFAADGSVKSTTGGIYDPANAAAGATEPGDLELHVVLKNNPGEPQTLTPIEVSGTAQGQVMQDLTAAVPDVGALNVTLWIRPATPPAPPVGVLTLVLKDPAGKELGTLTNQAGMPNEASFTVTPPMAGDYTVSATGQGVALAYGATFAITPPASAQLYFVFETVTIE